MKKWKYKPKGLFREVYAEMIFSAESLRINARAIFFALGVGMVVGVIGGFFSRLLGLSDVFRNNVSWSIFLLPLVGLLIVWLYKKGDIKTAGGTDIVVQAARAEPPKKWVRRVETKITGARSRETGCSPRAAWMTISVPPAVLMPPFL